MLFKRRLPLHPFRQLKEMIWPSMGWIRTYDYFRHRLFRESDSVHRITGGLALGMSVSFTPFLGLHLVQAVFYAWLLRLNIVAAIIGTLGGNPWTLPFMFWLDYQVGSAIFHFFGVEELIALPQVFTLTYLFENSFRLLMPLALGGIICAVLSWPVTYIILYLPVRSMRRAYRYQRLRRIRRKRQMRTQKI